jgi:hypothetical protein
MGAILNTLVRYSSNYKGVLLIYKYTVDPAPKTSISELNKKWVVTISFLNVFAALNTLLVARLPALGISATDSVVKYTHNW